MGEHLLQALEALRAGVAGEVEATHKLLSGVRAELAPWEAQIAAAKSRLDVATAERDLLLKQGANAQERLKVRPPGRQRLMCYGRAITMQGPAALYSISRLDGARKLDLLLSRSAHMQRWVIPYFCSTVHVMSCRVPRALTPSLHACSQVPQ